MDGKVAKIHWDAGMEHGFNRSNGLERIFSFCRAPIILSDLR